MRRPTVVLVLVFLRESQSRQRQRQQGGNGKGSQHGNPHRCFRGSAGAEYSPISYQFAAAM